MATENRWQWEYQEESAGPFSSEKVLVLVKHLKGYMQEDPETGELRFRRLKYVLLQAILKHQDGTLLKLKLNCTKLEFTLQWPDTQEYPRIKVGSGKRKRTTPDVLAPKVTIPGRKEKMDGEDFLKRMTSMVGTDMAQRLCQEFIKRMKGLES